MAPYLLGETASEYLDSLAVKIFGRSNRSTFAARLNSRTKLVDQKEEVIDKAKKGAALAGKVAQIGAAAASGGASAGLMAGAKGLASSALTKFGQRGADGFILDDVSELSSGKALLDALGANDDDDEKDGSINHFKGAYDDNIKTGVIDDQNSADDLNELRSIRANELETLNDNINDSIENAGDTIERVEFEKMQAAQRAEAESNNDNDSTGQDETNDDEKVVKVSNLDDIDADNARDGSMRDTDKQLDPQHVKMSAPEDMSVIDVLKDASIAGAVLTAASAVSKTEQQPKSSDSESDEKSKEKARAEAEAKLAAIEADDLIASHKEAMEDMAKREAKFDGSYEGRFKKVNEGGSLSMRHAGVNRLKESAKDDFESYKATRQKMHTVNDALVNTRAALLRNPHNPDIILANTELEKQLVLLTKQAGSRLGAAEAKVNKADAIVKATAARSESVTSAATLAAKMVADNFTGGDLAGKQIARDKIAKANLTGDKDALNRATEQLKQVAKHRAFDSTPASRQSERDRLEQLEILRQIRDSKN